MNQSNFENFPANSVDFHPISRANAVFTHQDKPAKEADDEVFHRHGQSGASKRYDRRKVIGWSKNNQKNEDHAGTLQRKQCQRSHGVELAAVHGKSREKL